MKYTELRYPLPNNPLRATNSYFVRGREYDLLIDSGFDLPECREALTTALEKLNSIPERRAVLGTHVHTDHIGIIHRFRGPGQPFYLSRPDVEYSRNVIESGEYFRFQENRFIKEGFPPEEYAEASRQKQAHNKGAARLDDDITMLEQDQVIDLGGIKLRLLICPGHTPGNSMYYIEREGILFTGDHILFDISPNITAWPYVQDALGNYLQNLKKYQNLPVKTALPGHRASGNYHERVDVLIQHHQQRLTEVAQLIRLNPGITAYELAGQMKWRIRSAHGWRDFPVLQKYYAVGECLSHCDYLLQQSRILMKQENNIITYYSL